MRTHLVCTLILLCAAPALAQGIDEGVRANLTWGARYQPVALKVSDVAVVTALALPCAIEERTWQCAGNQALRVGAAMAATEFAKHLVISERPDGSDSRSFWSGHAAAACSAGNLTRRRQLLGAALCAGAAYLRVAGKKHWFTDVAFGALAGTLAAKV